MTDRLKGCTVVFESDIREDDAQPFLDAIQQFRGVADVLPLVVTSDDQIARARVRQELVDALWKALRP
jgi:hypothetical protein